MTLAPQINTVIAYFISHKRAIVTCYQRLKLHVFTYLLTLLVVAVALILPSSLYLIVSNIKSVNTSWDRGTQINVYLKQDSSQEEIKQLTDTLKQHSEIQKIQYISGEQGLKEFQEHTSLKIDPKDTLPPVLVITPKNSSIAKNSLEKLQQQLQKSPVVTRASLDKLWVKRLNTMISLLDHFTLGLAIILSIGAILSVGNAVNCISKQHQKEITLYRLVGATNAYNRRPFLYMGAILGLSASLVAVATISLLVYWLNPMVHQLALLYQSQLSITGFNLQNSLLLLAIGTGLGIIGAVLANIFALKFTAP